MGFQDLSPWKLSPGPDLWWSLRDRREGQSIQKMHSALIYLWTLAGIFIKNHFSCPEQERCNEEDSNLEGLFSGVFWVFFFNFSSYRVEAKEIKYIGDSPSANVLQEHALLRLYEVGIFMFKENFGNTADSSLSLTFPEASLWPSRNSLTHRLLIVGVLDLHRAKYQSMRLNPFMAGLWAVLSPWCKSVVLHLFE